MEVSADELRSRIAERCQQLATHLTLLRDYATTPHNVWLARGELNKISEQVGELESLLAQLKQTAE